MPVVPARGVSTLLTHLGKPGGRPSGARLLGYGGARGANGSRSMDRYTRRPKARPSARDSVRQIAVVVVVGVSIGAGLFVGSQYVTAPSPVARLATRTAAVKSKTATAGTAVGDDSIYTGSILYMPQEGRTCRQLLFDNQSGRFSDNGYVDCVDAAYRSPGEPKFWSAARARVISNSFRND